LIVGGLYRKRRWTLVEVEEEEEGGEEGKHEVKEEVVE